MALHDVDKGHQRRSAPTPNTNDQVVSRPAHGTVQNHNAGEAALEDGLKLKERQILAVQNGFNKAAFGFYGTANKFGLKVAQEGVDVLTASDDQLIFNSEQNVFKILTSGFMSFTGGTPVSIYGSTWYIWIESITPIPHGLDYIPLVWSFVNNGVNYTMIGPHFENNSTVNGFSMEWYEIGATDTNIFGTRIVQVYNPGAAALTDIEPASVKYFVLQESAA